jgi:hypothetical protein
VRGPAGDKTISLKVQKPLQTPLLNPVSPVGIPAGQRAAGTGRSANLPREKQTEPEVTDGSTGQG